MKLTRIYGFRFYLTLCLAFLFVGLAAIGGSIFLIVYYNALKYLIITIILSAYIIFSAIYLYRRLIHRFRVLLNEGDEEIITAPIHHDQGLGASFLRLPSKDILLVGLFTKHIQKKFPEGQQISACYIKGKEIAILLRY